MTILAARAERTELGLRLDQQGGEFGRAERSADGKDSHSVSILSVLSVFFAL